MWTQKKIPKPLLVYFVALFVYVTAGSFISGGCTPAAPSCNPSIRNAVTVRTRMPRWLQLSSPDTDCLGSVTSSYLNNLAYNYGWRIIITVNNSNGVFFKRSYNSDVTLTTTEDWQAQYGDAEIYLKVPDCGKFTIKITVQRPEGGDCISGSSGNPAYMTWIGQSSTFEITPGTPGVPDLLGVSSTGVVNNTVNYATYYPII